MRKFHSDELKRFLASLDKHLLEQRDVILIGGAAASLAYGITWATTDIDTSGNIAGLEEALQLARQETGLDVPFQQVGIYDPPYHYEDRLVPMKLGFKKLRILVPEKHDLVLMKIVRGQDNDREAIQQISEHVGLDKSILVKRFKSEMTQAIGPPERLRANFLAAIEMLYGEAEADRINFDLKHDGGT